ncbi:MFS transporter [Aneurinibacillus danicus]|uniref:MFS transporter n=1 Tax=Aneurinibacillus danicus TaxID=267746 RepID=UPI001FEB3CA7|nr:MFS transporter [Aneurinibacillus danicus]
MKNQPLWNRNFLAVCFSSFFLFMTFYTLAVTLPMFATDTLRVDEKQIGLVMTVFVVAAVLFRPLAGKWVLFCNTKNNTYLNFFPVPPRYSPLFLVPSTPRINPIKSRHVSV